MSEWIKCSDRLPETLETPLTFGNMWESEYVLVYGKGWVSALVSQYQKGSSREGHEWAQWYDLTGGYELRGVTHWMPLPEPPKE